MGFTNDLSAHKLRDPWVAGNYVLRVHNGKQQSFHRDGSGLHQPAPDKNPRTQIGDPSWIGIGKHASPVAGKKSTPSIRAGQEEQKSVPKVSQIPS